MSKNVMTNFEYTANIQTCLFLLLNAKEKRREQRKRERIAAVVSCRRERDGEQLLITL